MARFSEQHEILKSSRTRARRYFFIKWFVWCGVGFVLIGGSGYGLMASGALTIARVRVEGVRLADHEKVIDVLATTAGTKAPRAWFGPGYMPFWFFLSPPESFFSAFPMFREATIDLDIFSREVVIRAEERELYGVWCLEGGACYAFDREGVIFGQAPTTFGTLVTKVSDMRTAPFTSGEVILPDTAWRAHLLRTLSILTGVRLTPRLITIREFALREWEVTLADGPVLKFSFMFVPERLDETLTTLSRRTDFQALTYLDFRVRDRLYYK